MRSRSSSQGGFSLVELLVALVVTLLIAGGIYGLLYDSNRTFGREPALSEQQQNARIALSMIEADLISAGAGAGAFVQTFTDGLDNTANDSDGQPSPPSVINPGENTDALELRAAVDECSTIQLCKVDTGAGGVTTYEPLPSCLRIPGLVVITDSSGLSYTRWACVPGSGTSASCQSGGGSPNGHLSFPSGAAGQGCTVPGQPCNPPGNPTAGMNLPAFMTSINKVRYEVRMGNDGVPSLWRSPTGGAGVGTTGLCDPETAGVGLQNDWQLVARGIEDLQVRYRSPANAGGNWFETPGTVACQDTAPCVTPPGPTDADFNTIVREVEVRISARVLASGRLQGESNVAGSVMARRSQLRTVISPRAALMALQARGLFR